MMDGSKIPSLSLCASTYYALRAQRMFHLTTRIDWSELTSFLIAQRVASLFHYALALPAYFQPKLPPASGLT
jgi:hypothetical protein